jgi:hypothetical protein
VSPRRSSAGGVPNYLGWSIVCTIVFFFPAGVVGIVASLVANRRAAQGDVEGGLRASRTARFSCIVSLALGVVGYALLATHVVALPS